jgi:hypothetical protein
VLSRRRADTFSARPEEPNEPLSSSTHSPEAITDPEGRFTFERIASGSCRVGGYKEGFAPQLNDYAFPPLRAQRERRHIVSKLVRLPLRDVLQASA